MTRLPLRRWAFALLAPLLVACEDGGITNAIPAHNRDVAALAVISGDGQSVQPGQTSPQPLVIRATDSRGVILRGVLITGKASAGSIAPAEGAYTNEQGDASFSWALPATVGTHRAEFSAPGSETARPVHATATVTRDAPLLFSVSDLVPGQIAYATGENLLGVDRLWIDSVQVTDLTRESDTRLSFRVPQLRPCEVDGRPVVVRVGADAHAQATGKMRPEGALSLAIGESKVVDPASGCLILPRDPYSYAFSVVSLSQEAAPSHVLTLGSRTATSPAASRTSSAYAPRPNRSMPPVFDDYAAIDSTLTQAAIGDTVSFADFSATDICTGARENAPLSRAIVVADGGSVVYLVDASLPFARDYLSDPEVANTASAAASLLDKLLLPTVRRLFDPAFAAPSGADGKSYLVVTNVPAGTDAVARPQESLPVSSCVGASGVLMVKLTAASRQWTPNAVATAALREFSSLGAEVVAYKSSLGALDSAHWSRAAFGEVALDVAARLSLNASENAQVAALRTDPTTPRPSWLAHESSETFAWSPFGVTPSDAGRNGPRVLGGKLVRFALQEAEQTAGATLGQTPLWRTTQQAGRVTEANLARALNLTLGSLLDRYALAEVTDDLVDPAAARTRGLPQVKAWQRDLGSLSTPADWARRFGAARILSRDVALSPLEVRVGGGSYHYWYLPSDPRTPKAEQKGISLELSPGANRNAIVRITRLR